MSTALVVVLLLAGPVIAVPKAAPEGQGESTTPAVNVVSPTVSDDAPVLVDGTPTIDLATPQAGASAPVETNSIVGAVVLSPDRCAIPVELPAEGEAVSSPNPPAEGAQRECANLVDAVPMVMTPAGAVPIAEGDGTSTTEQELLLRLGERRGNIETEQSALEQQALLLDAATKRLEERTAKLEELQATINALVGTRDQQSQEEIAAMVSLYQNMKPKDAAAVMSGLPDDVLLRIASNMSPRKMSPIIAEMLPARAQGLTVLMMDEADEPQL